MSVAERLKESKLIRGLRAKRLRPATLKSQSESVQSCYHNREDTTAAAGEEAEGWPPTHIMTPLFNNILYSVFIDSALFTLSESSHY